MLKKQRLIVVGLIRQGEYLTPWSVKLFCLHFRILGTELS